MAVYAQVKVPQWCAFEPSVAKMLIWKH